MLSQLKICCCFKEIWLAIVYYDQEKIKSKKLRRCPRSVLGIITVLIRIGKLLVSVPLVPRTSSLKSFTTSMLNGEKGLKKAVKSNAKRLNWKSSKKLFFSQIFQKRKCKTTRSQAGTYLSTKKNSIPSDLKNPPLRLFCLPPSVTQMGLRHTVRRPPLKKKTLWMQATCSHRVLRKETSFYTLSLLNRILSWQLKRRKLQNSFAETQICNAWASVELIVKSWNIWALQLGKVY